MSSTPVVPVAGTPAPAQKQNAIQLIEQELVGFFKQKEQYVANVHAVDGAIQATQHLLGKLRAEAAKAEAEAKKLLDEASAEAKEDVAAVEGAAGKVLEFVKKEL
jgi:hypothetical protein